MRHQRKWRSGRGRGRHGPGGSCCIVDAGSHRCHPHHHHPRSLLIIIAILVVAMALAIGVLSLSSLLSWCGHAVIVVSCIVAITVVITVHVVVVTVVVQVLGVHVVVLMVVVALLLAVGQCGVERPIFIILAWTRCHRGSGSSRWSWWWLRRCGCSRVVHAGRHLGGGDSRIVDAGGDLLLSRWSLLS